jgi:probable selenium-dependent hydroxylase accessory protein YqeC
MRSPHPTLLEAAGAAPGSVVSFIGGGGKTTLMLSLASAASSHGMRVLVTTTTRIRPPASMPLVLQDDELDLEADLAGYWSTSAVVALGRETTDTGKLVGVNAELLCHLNARFPQVLVLCEADGAAGRPLKIHAAHEPVIPECSSVVFVVGGLDALGRQVSDDTIHRVELLEKHASRARVEQKGTVSPRLFAQLLESAAGKVPPSCTVVFALTKPDLAGRQQVAEAFSAVGATSAHRSIVLVEYGRVVELSEALNA